MGEGEQGQVREGFLEEAVSEVSLKEEGTG